MTPPSNDRLDPVRRQLCLGLGAGLGLARLSPLLGAAQDSPRAVGGLHHAAKARRIVYLFQSGGPSQLDLFDHKPLLIERNGEELPDSVRRGQRLTGMSGNQSSLPLAGSQFAFGRHGQSGAWVSELLPHTAKIVDKLCFVRSMYTEAINHDPAVTFIMTGAQLAGRPSAGAWIDYGLGRLNADLPGFCVLVTKHKGGQPLYSRLWGSGFLPASHQGVQLRAGKDAVLYLQDPDGLPNELRARSIEALERLHRLQLERDGDPALQVRIEQGALARRMQTSVPEVCDLSDEPDETFELYGEDARDPGTFAANCLLARRLLERDVRCVQLFHKGWDQHGGLPAGIRVQCRETDQASTALVLDLERRGLLEDTLVLWGGEFGRTNYSQGALTATDYGRDHHPRCFTLWLAGAGVKAGFTLGETDEFGYNVVADPVHVHDLNATLLHLLGVDHERLTFKYQGRHFRLTDVHGRVVRELLV
jgi:hypothetical protein